MKLKKKIPLIDQTFNLFSKGCMYKIKLGNKVSTSIIAKNIAIPVKTPK